LTITYFQITIVFSEIGYPSVAYVQAMLTNGLCSQYTSTIAIAASP